MSCLLEELADTDHYMMVAKVRERLSVLKRTAYTFEMVEIQSQKLIDVMCLYIRLKS
jgi:hypothetical protein